MTHDNTHRPRLTDILNGGADSLRDAWNRTEAADDFAPLPAGTYIARIIGGDLTAAKTGTPGYKLAFRVLEGEHEGRQFWHDIWLTPAAMPMAKRDLGKLGIQSLEQLEQPLPPGIRVKAKVAMRKDDDGAEHNRVRSFDVLGVDTVEDEDFAPGLSGDGADDDEPAGAEADPEPGGGAADSGQTMLIETPEGQPARREGFPDA